MGLEDQAAVKRVADEHGSGVVVLLGTPDAESTQTLAQTVVAGDPSYAGPLAGVPLGLPVFHVFEPEVRDQVPADVYEAQVALMAPDRGGPMSNTAKCPMSELEVAFSLDPNGLFRLNAQALVRSSASQPK